MFVLVFCILLNVARLKGDESSRPFLKAREKSTLGPTPIPIAYKMRPHTQQLSAYQSSLKMPQNFCFSILKNFTSKRTLKLKVLEQ